MFHTYSRIFFNFHFSLISGFFAEQAPFWVVLMLFGHPRTLCAFLVLRLVFSQHKIVDPSQDCHVIYGRPHTCPYNKDLKNHSSPQLIQAFAKRLTIQDYFAQPKKR